MSFDFFPQVQLFFSFPQDIFVSIDLFLKIETRYKFKNEKQKALDHLFDEQRFQHVVVAFDE